MYPNRLDLLVFYWPAHPIYFLVIDQSVISIKAEVVAKLQTFSHRAYLL